MYSFAIVLTPSRREVRQEGGSNFTVSSVPSATPAPSDKGDGLLSAEKEDLESREEKVEKEAKASEKMETEVCA